MTIAAAGLLLASASAQSASPRARRVTTPVVDAGTLHLANGVWTPADETTQAPGATVFNNDAAQPYYLALRSGEEVADFGRIPGATPIAPMVGSEHGQTVDGFQFAYTTRERRGRFGYIVSFFDNYSSGDSPLEREPVAVIELMDLPGAPRAGEPASYKVTVNLRFSPYDFILGRDEEGGGADARFGWSLSCTNTRHGAGGPILAGDPLGDFGPAAATGDGTSFNANVGAPGTGLGSEDAFWAEGRRSSGPQYVTDIPNAPISFGSFHLQLYANTQYALGASTNIGTNYCEGSADNLMYRDGFESGGFNEGDWTAVIGNPQVVFLGEPDGWEGHRVARLYPNQRIAKQVSTLDREQLTLKYRRRIIDDGGGINLIVEWFNGASWNIIEELHEESDWTQKIIVLPEQAAGLSAFMVRFRVSGAGVGGGSLVHIDEVQLAEHGIGHIEAFGSESIADNNITMVATGLPSHSFGMFFYGSGQVQVPLGLGFRCVGGSEVQRLMPLLRADGSGVVSRPLDFTSTPMSTSFITNVPVTANFQYWHRQNGLNNLTDAIGIELVQ